jgi:hypothetical protein
VHSKKLSNLAFDLDFERFLEEYDKAVEVVTATEEHQGARREWMEQRGYGASD